MTPVTLRVTTILRPEAGTWKIEVSLSGFAGTINFRVQKRTP